MRTKALKRKFSLILFVIFLFSCSTKKTNVINYNSERLCVGINDISQFIKNSNDVKKYFLINSSSSTVLNYEVDTLVNEGISLPFLQYEVTNIIKNEDGISFEDANEKLQAKLFSKPKIKINSNCLKKTNADKPEVKIEYYYFPEYSLLTAEISKIKYTEEYGKGYLILARLDPNGKIGILKTTFWEE